MGTNILKNIKGQIMTIPKQTTEGTHNKYHSLVSNSTFFEQFSLEDIQEQNSRVYLCLKCNLFHTFVPSER